MHEVYFLLGTNLGDKKANLSLAGDLIASRIGSMKLMSSIYMSAPWGKPDQPDFLNQVILVETKKTPEVVLNLILNIEKEIGRKRVVKWGERIIDIDILFYDDLIINTPDLVIPHPAIAARKFTLMPLNEIASTFIHPVLNQSIDQLLRTCSDPLVVTLAD